VTYHESIKLGKRILDIENGLVDRYDPSSDVERKGSLMDDIGGA
jgi:hypothetical protein